MLYLSDIVPASAEDGEVPGFSDLREQLLPGVLDPHVDHDAAIETGVVLKHLLPHHRAQLERRDYVVEHAACIVGLELRIVLSEAHFGHERTHVLVAFPTAEIHFVAAQMDKLFCENVFKQNKKIRCTVFRSLL